jgi:protein-S-isoprenylcysteine O-methyltransferase Ste14
MTKPTKLLGRYLLYAAISALPMLLGWGVDDLVGFLRSPARAAYAVLIAAGGLLIFVPRLNIPWFSKGKQIVGRGMLRAWIASGYVLLVFLPFGDRRGLLTFADWAALRWAGITLVLVGTTIRLAGVWWLGKQVSGHVTIQENHQLVQAGIYRHLRNPMYLGFTIATAGLTLVFRSWLVFPALVWTLIFVLVRIGQEERLLGEHFGDEFKSYCRRTWRLLPYVY